MPGGQVLQRPDGASLYFEIHGTGAPLLLVAGMASDSQSWGPLVQDLAEDFLVITPDNRGVGRSTQAGVEISIRTMADDCMALLDALGIASATIVGHSMGGFIALECALRYPGRVSGLVLEGSAPGSPPETIRMLLNWADELVAGAEPAAWFRDLLPWLFTGTFLADPQVMDEAVRGAVEYPYPQSPAAFRKQVQAIAAFDCSGQLGTVNLPTLILHGSDDRLFPAAASIAALSAIRGARSTLIDRAAHAVHVEQPEAFVSAIRAFRSELLF